MGAVGGLLGLSGGASGTGFASPQAANIDAPTTVKQVNTAYGANQQALAQQQALLEALQRQNGLQNQSAVYNQLADIAAGRGPNPAQAMLNQATGQNVANQAALMAGQRGANANVGLLARQAAQQGAQTQQQSAGQAATMEAQQALNALQAQGQLANTQANQQINATSGLTQAQQNEQNNLLNAIAAQNNAKIGMQSNINTANAGLASQSMGMQGQIFGGLAGGIGTGFGLLKAEGGEVKRYDDGGQVIAGSGQYAPIDPNSDVFDPQNQEKKKSADMNIKPGQSQLYDPRSGNNITSASNAATSAAAPKSSFAKFIAGMNSAGNTNDPIKSGTGALGQAIGSALRNAFSSSPSPSQPINMPQAGGSSDVSPGQAQPDVMNAAKGGPVPALVSPGERYLSPRDVEKVKAGSSPMSVGEKIPGKAKVGGAKNSYANDTVPKTLEEGGIVLPRSVTQSKQPHIEAMKFVKEVMRKQKAKK